MNLEGRITEDQARKALEYSRATTDQRQRQALGDILARYKRQQEEAGEPVFPSDISRQAEEDSRFRRMFQDRERHGLDDAGLSELRTFARDPEQKAAFFNDQFLSRVFGEPTEKIRPIQQAYIESYSRKAWGEVPKTQAEFFSRVADDLDVEDGANDHAQAVALRGGEISEVWGTMPETIRTNPAYSRREWDFRQQYEETFRATARRVEPYRQVIADSVRTLRAEMGVSEEGDGRTMNDVVESLLDVPERDRNLVIAAIMRAGDEGEEKGAIQKTGENIGRGAADVARGAIDSKLLLGAVSSTYSRKDLMEAREQIAAGRIPLGTIGSPRSILDESLPDSFRSESSPLIQADINDESVKEALRLVDREIERDELTLRIRDIAENKIDPATGERAITRGLYSAARSIPYTLAAISGPVGFAATAQAMESQSYQVLRQTSGIAREDAAKIAGVSGIAQAALERVTGKLLTGTPVFQGLLNRVAMTGASRAANVGVRLGLGAGQEMVTENLQDLTPFFLQSAAAALSDDVPGVDWGKRMEEMGANQAELFWAVLPLSLVGAGVGSLRDSAAAREIVTNYDMLVATGINQSDAGEIVSAARNGDWRAAEKSYRAAFAATETGASAAPQAEVRAEAAARVLSEQAENRARWERGEKLDLVPGVRRTDEGWSLQFSDGTASPTFGTWQEAADQRAEIIASRQISLHAATRSVMERMESALEPGREIRWEFDPTSRRLADEVEAGNVSESAALNRDEIARQAIGEEFARVRAEADLIGQSIDDRLAGAVILGKNVTEYQDGIYKTTVRLFQDASPLTLIEEKAESDADILISNGRRQWLLDSLREYESISGDSLFLKGKSDESLTDGDIKEAWSALAQSYFVGRNTKGRDLFGGKSFRDIAAEMMRTRIGGAISAYGLFFRAVWRRAAKISKLRRDGKFSPEVEKALVESLGLTEQAAYESSVEAEVVEDIKRPDRWGAALAALGNPDVGFEAEPVEPSTYVPTEDAPFSAIPAENRAADIEGRISKLFSPYLRDPERRSRIMLEAQRRGRAAAADWRETLRARRTSAEIERERKQKEAEIFTEKLGALGAAKLDSLGLDLTNPELRPILSQLVTKEITKGGRVRYRGRLVSRSAAKKAGYSSLGEYDDMPEGVPSYVFGGTVDIDTAAQGAGFDSVPEFWAALGSELQSYRQRVEEQAASKAEIAQIKEEARNEARKWAESETQRVQERAGNRQTLVGALRTFDAIISALPPEVRSRVGGFARLAKFATPEAMTREIERRAARIDAEIEKYLIRDSQQKAEKFFSKTKLKRDSVGRAGADVHTVADAVRKSWEDQWTAEEAESEASRLESLIAGGEMTAEEEARTTMTAELLRMFGGWRDMDAQARFAALDEMRRVWSEGLADYGAEQAALKEKLDASREAMLAGTGKAGSWPEKKKAELEGLKMPGKIKKILAGLLNFDQVVGIAYGEVPEGREFADRERQADEQKRKSVDEAFEGVENLFSRLAGGFLKGEKLQYALSHDHTITARDAKGQSLSMTQMEAVQALLMWRQPDGRRHMMGVRSSQTAPLLDADYRPLLASLVEEVETVHHSPDGSASRRVRTKQGPLRPDLRAAYPDLPAYLFGGNESVEKVATRKKYDSPDELLADLRAENESWVNRRNTFDGEIVSTWAYDQSFIDEIESQLSPEARAVMAHISEAYGREYDQINPVFRRVKGLNLPRNDQYSPITVKPGQRSANETIDPVTGSTMSAGRFTPGSLRSRTHATAEPEFRDALQVYLAHVKQIQHWIAYAELNRDASRVMGDRRLSNAVEARHGREFSSVIGKWLDALANGGTRDAAAGLAGVRLVDSIVGNVQAIALIGRIGTLAVQVTQLAAASAKMPTRAYLRRLGLLLAGRGNWGAALDSAYMRGRISEQPAVVQGALAGLRGKKPNKVKYAARQAGRLIGATDALFTAGTYAMLLDYHKSRLTADLPGADAAEIAAAAEEAAQRDTDAVAQPTRLGTRSIYEVTSTNPFARMAWAYGSESRKNAALMIYAQLSGAGPRQKAAAVGFVMVSALMSAAIKSAWRDARDDDDDEVFDGQNWSIKRLALATATDWLHGFPVFGDVIQGAAFAAAGERTLGGFALDTPERAARAVKEIATLDSNDVLRDIETMLMAAGYVSQTAAGLSSWMHVVRDIAGVLKNFLR